MYKKTKRPVAKVKSEIINAKNAINLVLMRLGNLSKLKLLSKIILFIMECPNYVSTDTKLNKINLQWADILNLLKGSKQ